MAFDNESDIATAMGVDQGPSLYINDKQYSGINNLAVGEEVTWTIKGIVQSIDAHGATSYSKASANASINITEIDGKKSTVAPSKKSQGNTLAEPSYDYDD